jgi:iron complex outermembrane recepter protein
MHCIAEQSVGPLCLKNVVRPMSNRIGTQLVAHPIAATAWQRGKFRPYVHAYSNCLLIFALLFVPTVRPQDTSPDLANQSLEDLMKIEVTSASKKPESMSKAPAAIYVITGEDIRRGGFSSVPDALRSVPGLYVVQQSAHVWLISARGFSDTFNNKMLVLLDGRSVYSTTFGGVFWDVLDPPMEDIDRVEVIRGPGGTLWGANAVNGVINIITKDAGKTQGVQVASSAGINEGYASRVRYGGKMGDDLSYRIYGTSNYWLPTVDSAGSNSYDNWDLSQGGIRVDWKASQNDTIMFDGAGYSGHVRDTVEQFSPTALPSLDDYITLVKGGHLLANWKHTYSGGSATSVLGYCDWNDRVGFTNTDYLSTCNIEFQHDYAISKRQTLTFGGGFNANVDTWPTTFTTSFLNPTNDYTIFTGLVQYDLTLVPDTLRVIAGSKFDHNSYNGFEYQPQVRAVWTPNSSNTLWVALSRAVRTPDKVDNDVIVRVAQLNPDPPPLTFLLISGSPSVQAEILHAYEFGYRYSWKEKFFADTAIYYNDYDSLGSLSGPGAPIVNPSPFYLDIPEHGETSGTGQTHGLEMSLRYLPIRRWRISAGITELRGASSPGVAFPASAYNPRQQFTAQSRLNLTRYLNFDSAWYHYNAVPDELPLLNRVDVGVSTNPLHGFSFSVWGRNLQQDRHVEAISETFLQGEIQRTVVFKVLWELDSRPDTVASSLARK